MPLSLASIRAALEADFDLADNVTRSELAEGLAAVDSLSGLLIQMLQQTGVNDDGLISTADMMALSDALRADPALVAQFMAAHGNDEWDEETGYHLLQNDGGSLEFQGRNLADTVVDGLFHFGFSYADGRFVNEDGNPNEEVADVAGWLNYFLNGVNVVHGTEGDDDLYSGDYSPELVTAANETWLAGAGNDHIWADRGNDTVWAGTGDDQSGGGYGNDVLQGEAGADTLWGEQGHDRLDGGEGDDVIGAGTGRDTAQGGAGDDKIYGETGADNLSGDLGNDLIYGGTEQDTLNGGAGDDTLGGAQGNDLLQGGAGADGLWGDSGADRLRGDEGNDSLSAGAGADTLEGGAGADQFFLWEEAQASDVLIFNAGDSGRTRATIDTVEGFAVGSDKIDLRAFVGMTFEDLDYTGEGVASCYFDGRYLRIDHTGDGRSDMIIAFKWIDELTAGDFLFA